MLRNIALSITVTALLLAALAEFDRLVGPALIGETASIIFPPFSTAHHRSSEFDLTVRINNLGFRGPDASISKQRPRALLLGDSFTFGWGVNEEETWAAHLRSRFPDMEILNLGQGGTHPGDHVQLARKAMPLLKPDVVMVSVLLGNDLHQLMRIIAYERGDYTPTFPQTGPDRGPLLHQRALQRFLPNLSRRYAPTVEIGHRWKAEADAVRTSFTAQQLERYSGLDADVRHAFEQGMLNPSLIFQSMHFPDAYCEAADTSVALLRDVSVRLRDHLIELRQLCHDSGARLIAIGLSDRPYGCADCVPDLLRLGFNASGCDTLDAAAPLRWAANGADVQVLIPSMTMRSALFFPLDGHWNRAGHLTFAEALIPYLTDSTEWNSSQTSGSF